MGDFFDSRPYPGWAAMTPAAPQSCVVLVAGETSGDQHGARVVSAMQQKDPGLFFCGIGGPALQQAGVRIVADAASLSVVGITEVFAKLPAIINGLAVMKKLLKSLRPELLILIDFPDFNLCVAATAKKLGIPVLYYISPQVWAWRRGRVRRIARLVDHMAVILPFEENFYRQHDVPVTFVGHPLLDDPSALSRQSLKITDIDRPVIGLLPGSRSGEIARHLPVMLETAAVLKAELKRAEFIISHAPSVLKKQIDTLMAQHPGAAGFEVISGPVETVFERSDVVVAASGTVTLQAALHGTPMVIIYRVSPVSFWLGRALVRVPHIGLVNLVAGRQIVAELVQHDARADKIAAAVGGLLHDKNELNILKRQLLGLHDLLGGPGAAARVADIALGLLDQPAA
ncbi:MAG: lipid-A-disaccharide synthase [Desulfobacteraceae bacterium 4572_123]|nr:MAG: lipid-A-disaccharide synthase [Desulfobacteraceae bacterium 4572_123]